MKLMDMVRKVVTTDFVDFEWKILGFDKSDMVKVELKLKDKENLICELLKKNGYKSPQERRLIARRELGIK